MVASAEDLRNVAVLVAFGGWADAGQACLDALDRLSDLYPTQELSSIDDERYWDFQRHRPDVVDDGDGHKLIWPEVTVRLVRHPDRDLIVVSGPEPDLMWRTFTNQIVGIIRAFEPKIALFLGAMVADTPHSRDLPVSVYSDNQDILADFPSVEPSSYAGPTGVMGVIANALDQIQIPTAQSWVLVPHYVTSPPSPKAQLSLTTSIESFLEISLDHQGLELSSEKWTEAIDELVADDTAFAAYVDELAEEHDREEAEQVSGDRIAAELERYLRKQMENPSDQ